MICLSEHKGTIGEFEQILHDINDVSIIDVCAEDDLSYEEELLPKIQDYADKIAKEYRRKNGLRVESIPCYIWE